MELNDLEDLFVHQLERLFDSEEQLEAAFTKMAHAAASGKLRELLKLGAEASRGQRMRIEKISPRVGLLLGRRRKTSGAMRNLILEGCELIDSKVEAHVRDAGLNVAAQMELHYQIVAYRSTRTYADAHGMKMVKELLRKTINEKSEIDTKLSNLAVRTVNLGALPSNLWRPSTRGEGPAPRQY